MTKSGLGIYLETFGFLITFVGFKIDIDEPPVDGMILDKVYA
jgi:hypothetical protein